MSGLGFLVSTGLLIRWLNGAISPTLNTSLEASAQGRAVV